MVVHKLLVLSAADQCYAAELRAESLQKICQDIQITVCAIALLTIDLKNSWGDRDSIAVILCLVELRNRPRYRRRRRRYYKLYGVAVCN